MENGKQALAETNMDREFYGTLYAILGLTKSSIDLIDFLRKSPHSIIYSNKYTKDKFKLEFPYSDSTIKQAFKQLKDKQLIISMTNKGMYILNEDFFNSNTDHMIESSIQIKFKSNGKKYIEINAKGSSTKNRRFSLSQNS
jgi:hypothetical protein